MHSSSLMSDKQSTQEFPLGAKVCRESKASKITNQRLGDLEVWGFWKWWGHSRQLLFNNIITSLTGHLSAHSLLIIPTTNQPKICITKWISQWLKRLKGGNSLLETRKPYLFLLVNSLSCVQEYLMSNCKPVRERSTFSLRATSPPIVIWREWRRWILLSLQLVYIRLKIVGTHPCTFSYLEACANMFCSSNGKKKCSHMPRYIDRTVSEI